MQARAGSKPNVDAGWSWFVALDGPDINGLIGTAGLLRFDWPQATASYRFYEGVSSGHNVSLCPSGRRLLLGNFSQQFVLIDTASLEVIDRRPSLGHATAGYPLRSHTHHLWLDDDTFIAALGDDLYVLRADPLGEPVERLGGHGLHNAHELRWSSDRRYILMGDLGPEKHDPRQIAVFDVERGQSTVIPLPGTAWHTVVHPSRPVGYAATYTVLPDGDDYVRWSPAYRREYIFEIDLPSAKVRRVWSAGAEFPIHLNSDLEVYEDGDESWLYVASGGSHTVAEIELESFTDSRVVEVTPPWWQRTINVRQAAYNWAGAIRRASAFTNLHMLAHTSWVTSGRPFDGVYAVRVSPDGRYVVAGHRGYNYIRVMERRTLQTVHECVLPTLTRPRIHRRGPYQSRRFDTGLHLGLHHSEMAARA